MKTMIIILLIFFIGTYNVHSQEVVMTKEKHEQLRKNVEDYKNLIKVHKTLQLKTNALSKENETQKERIKTLESELAICKNTPKKKNIFHRIGVGIGKFTRKLNPHKDKQNW